VTADADAYAAKVTSEADQQRRLIVTEAAAEARRLAEAARSEVLSKINELEARRDALLADLDVLETHVEDERSRIGSALQRMQEVLDDPSEFRAGPAPDLAEPLASVAEVEPDVVDPASESDWSPMVDGVAETDDADETWDAGEDWDDEDDEDDDAPTAAPVVSSPASVFEDVDDVESVGGGIAATASDSWSDDGWDDDEDVDEDETSLGSSLFDDGPGASVTDLASARNEVLRPAEAPLPSPEPVGSRYPDDREESTRLLWDDEPVASDGPPTEAVLIDDLLSGENSDNDRFLDELRRATEDEFGADDSDAAIAAFFDQDEDDKPAKRRGRRT
jgi:hypothetical protein